MAQNFLVRQADNDEACHFEGGGTSSVVDLATAMALAVDLHDKPDLRTDEVHDERAERLLSSELEPCEATAS
jgi:hypothetical protein